MRLVVARVLGRGADTRASGSVGLLNTRCVSSRLCHDTRDTERA